MKGTSRALAMSVDGNGRFCALDPRQGARLAVAEAARSGRVAIDTRRPTPVAKWSAAALRGARTTLRYYVSDRRPGSPTATVTIRIYDTRSTLVKKAVAKVVALLIPGGAFIQAMRLASSAQYPSGSRAARS